VARQRHQRAGKQQQRSSFILLCKRKMYF
jgi:hypothetical protein